MKFGVLLDLVQDELIVLNQKGTEIEIDVKNIIEYSMFLNSEVKGIYHSSYYKRVEIEIE
jgi:hypothetical protein